MRSFDSDSIEGDVGKDLKRGFGGDSIVAQWICSVDREPVFLSPNHGLYFTFFG